VTPGGPSFRVTYSERIAERLQLPSDLAAANRRLDRYLELVAAMQRHLADLPETWGDPVFPYQHLDLQVYHRSFEMVHVTYSVDSVRRIVYIQHVGPTTARGLDLLP
jgi:hypothetical protein